MSKCKKVNNYTNDCSHICFNNQKKLLIKEKKCILNCSSDNVYKYEYKNLCYEKCPEGTTNISNSYQCEINTNDSNINQPKFNEEQTINFKTESISNSYFFNEYTSIIDNKANIITDKFTNDKVNLDIPQKKILIR